MHGLGAKKGPAPFRPAAPVKIPDAIGESGAPGTLHAAEVAIRQTEPWVFASTGLGAIWSAGPVRPTAPIAVEIAAGASNAAAPVIGAVGGRRNQKRTDTSRR